VPRPIQPFLRIRQNVQNAGGSHSFFEETVERTKASRVWIASEALQDCLSFVDLQIFILRIPLICFAGRFLKGALQGGDESFRLRGNARAFRIRFEILTALLFAHELLSEIAVAVAAWDPKIAGLQLAHNLSDRAKFEPAPRDPACILLGLCVRHHERPPRLTNEREIERQCLGVLA
jgi:hypothetical protein